MENYKSILEKKGFLFNKKTSKSEVFNRGKEYIYYVDNLSPIIVLNPETVFNNDELKNNHSGLLHNTSFHKFIKRKNNGLQKIHYGYKFEIESLMQLDELLNKLNEEHNASLYEIWISLLEDISNDDQEITVKLDDRDYKIYLKVNDEDEILVISSLESLHQKVTLEDFEYYYPLYIESRIKVDNINENTKHDVFFSIFKVYLNDMRLKENQKLYSEGKRTKVLRNKYERNIEARNKCLEYYGYDCRICGFNFEEVYGELGQKFIHVHHVEPLFERNEVYTVDPIKDLIPVCPNCHSMLHKNKKTIMPQELKNILKSK